MSQPALQVYVVYVALAAASALAVASALAPPLTLTRTYLPLAYPTSVAAYAHVIYVFIFPALSSTLHSWIFFQGCSVEGGVPGRREPDTEPSGVVGGCGKPSACSGCSPPRWRSTWFCWFFDTFFYIVFRVVCNLL